MPVRRSARVCALLLPLSAALLACNSSSTSTPAAPAPTDPGDTTAPIVTSSNPVDGATGVVRNSAVTATFNEDIFAATVDSSSFTLANGGSISGLVNFDGATNIATFTPDSNLAVLTTYIATLSNAISDLAGNPLAGDYTWSFTTVDGLWGAAELIETDNAGDASLPQIAFNSSGNAIAVWEQFDGTRNNIWANRYETDAGWGVPGLIETSNAGYAYKPQIAFDANGNAIAVWNQSDGVSQNIYANQYTAVSGWGTPELIETLNMGDAYNAQIAFDPSGNALAVWYQSDGARYNIYANRYVAGSGWGSAELIETDSAGDAYFPQLATDASGDAIAVWQQNDGTRFNTWANHYVAGSGWGVAELIETDDVGGTYFPQIAIDTSGNALAVWQQSDGTRYNLWANRYGAGTGWGAAELIETDNAGGVLRPQIAIDASGNALAVWYQNDGIRDNIWANRYTTGAGWGTAELIETENAGLAIYPQIAIDANGNAISVWYQNDGTRYNILANRYTAGAGWGTAELLETDNVGDAFNPQIAVDASGNALAVWAQNDGAQFNIWANRFE